MSRGHTVKELVHQGHRTGLTPAPYPARLLAAPQGGHISPSRVLVHLLLPLLTRVPQCRLQSLPQSPSVLPLGPPCWSTSSRKLSQASPAKLSFLPQSSLAPPAHTAHQALALCSRPASHRVRPFLPQPGQGTSSLIAHTQSTARIAGARIGLHTLAPPAPRLVWQAGARLGVGWWQPLGWAYGEHHVGLQRRVPQPWSPSSLSILLGLRRRQGSR